jgi:xanthine dehydrogenase small subunit
MRNSIRFVRNGRVVTLSDIRPGLLLLDYLRLVERATGTKASCEQGACGACTVVIGRLRNGRLVYEPVNACTLLVAQIDGCEVITIEDIAEDDGALHPVQEALVEEHATQCGFCTAGMGLSLFALFTATDEDVDETDARAAIQGNLCRCTGYRPIINAGVRAAAHRRSTRHQRSRQETTAQLASLADGEDISIGDDIDFLAAPASLDSAVSLSAERPAAKLIAGGTAAADGSSEIILLSRVSELRRIDDGEAELTLGGAVTLAEAEPLFDAIDTDFGTLTRSIGGPQLRAQATVGGSLMGAKETGDMATALIALGAELTVRHNGESRRIAAEALYRSDGTVDSEPGELLVEIHVPRPKPDAILRAYKVGRHSDVGTAAVTAVFHLSLDAEGRIESTRFAFAGLSPAPKRASAAEAALDGADPLDRSTWPKAFAALREDFSSNGEHRALGRYRAETAQALLGKALIEAGGTSDRRTRLGGFREVDADVAG